MRDQTPEEEAPDPLSPLLERIRSHPVFAADELVAVGLAEKAAAVVAAYARARAARRSLLVLVPAPDDATALGGVVKALLPGDACLLEPWDALPFEPTSLEPSVAGNRVEALALLAGVGGRTGIVLASAAAVARRTLAAPVWQANHRWLSFADEIPPSRFRHQLARYGYHLVAEVSDIGDYAVRGGILDFFPPGLADPVRVEWDGDMVASLRSFDIQSQRSIGQVESVLVLPPRELILPDDADARGAATDAVRAAVKPSLRRDRFLEAIETGTAVEGLEVFLPFLAETASVLELGDVDVLLVDEASVAEQVAELGTEAAEEATESDLGYSADKLWLAALPGLSAARRCHSLPREGVAVVASEPLPPAPPDAAILRTDLSRLRERGDDVLVVSTLAARVREIARGEKLDGLVVLDGELVAGARLTDLGLALVGDGDLFGHRRRRTVGGRRRKPLAWGALNPGEYVAHVHHGIGVFRGIERITTLGETRDVILIEYAGGDRLYLPPHETSLLERYAAPEGGRVRLDKLGSVSWSKLRQKVERETAEIARELLDLYALRSATKGAVYAALDDEESFAEAFGYEETADQEKAIDDILADLAKTSQSLPMDRLLCGDVGFGKTEVSLRAAYRVVRSGRQVAVLCPTTILALQHTETFRERLGPFGVRVATLSRFQSAREIRETLAELAAGSVAVVIGTHKLFSAQVRYRDLGLVVIDEEQRFGVRHKEHLKKLRRSVDVLTMTATPIPRTLHLALSGVRSISLIETPPPGRAPVQTVVEPYNEEHVRQAIRRELDRGGQVFYVHNRIATLDRVHEFLRRLFPKETIDIGHGRMPEEELEGVMKRFLHGETTILLSTSIVENGLDIPRANTLIVDMAESFGLSDLYQLRGRVGRSKLRAYAYFFYTSDRSLAGEARERLAAIAEHTALGSGYAIARRDMEIRGAGEILGAAQHGEMEAVGYDMYCRLLREAVGELRGEKPQRKKRPIVDLAVSNYLPAEWLGGEELVSEVHREISAAETIAEIETLRDSLIDRFGQPPVSVENLLELARLRAYAALDGLESIIENEHGVEARWNPMPEGIEAYLTALPPPAFVEYRDGAVIIERLPQGQAKLEFIRRLLRR